MHKDYDLRFVTCIGGGYGTLGLALFTPRRIHQFLIFISVLVLVVLISI